MTESIKKSQSAYDLLKRESLLSWTVLKWGWEHHILGYREIQDYAISQLEYCSNDDVEILAGLSKSDQDTIIQILGKLAEKEPTVQDASDNWLLASLLLIQESNLDTQGKLDRLQEIYSEFNYPDCLSKCSIYYADDRNAKLGDFLSDPLMEMQKAIAFLFHKLGKIFNIK